MVYRKNLKKKFALISVYNKNRLKYLCSNLINHNYSLISTGSTGETIRSMGFKCIDVSKVTKFKEMFSGRIKTINPLIYGSLLYDRNNKSHKKEFLSLKVPEINIVVINLYPFNKFKNSKKSNKVIEMIDIGGPSLLRAASKNYKFITPIINTLDYPKLINNLKKNCGETDIIFRKKMAHKIFNEISKYDKMIANWFNDFQISGKKISYNNIIDIDSGLKCLSEFTEPTSVIVKHTNPCGVASAKSIDRAFIKSYNSDSKSAFGGLIFLNRKVKLNLANKIIKNFFEMIVAPDFEKKAIKKLTTKKNLILIKIPVVKIQTFDFRSTIFGKLYQTIDKTPINRNFINLVSQKKTSKKSIDDLLFSLKVVKHLKSNAIVISKNKQTLGLGHGQTNRVDALKFAIRNKKLIFNEKKFVCVSD